MALPQNIRNRVMNTVSVIPTVVSTPLIKKDMPGPGSGLGYGRLKLMENVIRSVFGVDPSSKLYSFKELLYIIQEMSDYEGKDYLLAQQGDKVKEMLYKKFVQLIFYRNLADYDTMLLITGVKGSGKSSIGLVLCREWCKMLGIRFNPERHVAYSNADVMNKIKTLNKFEPLLLDESARFISSEDWAKKENRALKKRLAEVRTKHLFFVACFPMKVEKVQKEYLSSFVQYWIDLIDRGIGPCYVKDMNPAHDAWRIKDFKDLGSYNEFTDPHQIEEILKKHPNFWQLLRFPKPPAAVYANYLRTREKNVYHDDIARSTVGPEDITNALLILALRDIMSQDEMVSIARIAIHIKNKYDFPLTKTMIDFAVKDAVDLVSKIRDEATLANG